MCSVREATRSRSIEAGIGAVALMRARLLVPAPAPGAVNPPSCGKRSDRVPAQRGAAHLARARARERLGELDDPRVLVRRGLGLDVVLQLARERVARVVAVA